jgi:fructokinase
MTVFGGIEAGGTKFICMVGSGPHDILAESRFPTTDPEETIGRAVEFFRRQAEQHAIERIGVASFGPVDLNPNSPAYGSITSTPKPGWANTNVVSLLHTALDLPVAFDTDVNAAALGEFYWGAAQGLEPFIYYTIGTGIGGGGIVNGLPLHGLLHPEMGHILIPHDRQADPFPGSCPYHGDCFEGLASGSAMRARWGRPSEQLPADHPAWQLEAHYIAYAMVNQICTFSPRRIVLGGGVMQYLPLFPLIRRKVLALLNDYVQSPAITEGIDSYIVPPALGNRAGVLGAIALAKLKTVR